MTYQPETIAIHSGINDDPYNSLVAPLYLTSTYEQESPGVFNGYCYTRSGNPTRASFERAIADLEGAKRGFAFATGMAAENALLQALLEPGSVVLIPQDVYGGTYRILNTIFAKWGVETRRADFTDLERVAELAQGATIVWAESPTNPRLEVYDLPEIVRIGHEAGALVVADNTFATPLGQSPIAFGADVILHSVTKYLAGHSDLVLGALVTSNDELAEKIAYVQNAAGSGASPLDCWLALRGIRSFPLRFREHCKNAEAVAKALEAAGLAEGVSRVYYPTLESHATRAAAAKTLKLGGGIVSLELAGGFEAAKRFVCELKLFKLAESLGGVKSLSCHPASMTHASVPAAERAKVGLSDGLVRLSVGLEHADDLVADIKQALQAVATVGATLAVS